MKYIILFFAVICIIYFAIEVYKRSSKKYVKPPDNEIKGDTVIKKFNVFGTRRDLNQQLNMGNNHRIITNDALENPDELISKLIISPDGEYVLLGENEVLNNGNLNKDQMKGLKELFPLKDCPKDYNDTIEYEINGSRYSRKCFTGNIIKLIAIMDN